MPDVFISYSQLDNRDLVSITYEVPNAVDRFLEIYEYEFGLSTAAKMERFFRDEWSIRPGEMIPEQIEQAIRECPVMLTFCSPNYFASVECFEEWRAYDEMRKRAEMGTNGGPKKLLIPIEVKPSETVGLDLDQYPDAARWHEELITAAGRKRIISSDDLIKEENGEKLAVRIRELGRLIDEHLAVRRGTAIEKASDPNMLRFQTPIIGATLKSEKIVAELKKAKPLRYNRHLPVCVIYAGGTVGMVRTQDSDPVHADYEMASGIEDITKPLMGRLSSLPVDLHLFRLDEAIDSSAVTAANWVDLATLIREQANNYQGFVILHGTNTLAYSASALSFLLSDSMTKPVILTGSEVPLSHVNTDAMHNVENAIRAAAHQAYGGPILIREVCVYWNNNLYRGNRVTKKIASDRSSSFHTPNMAVSLATLANDKLDVEYMHVNPISMPEPGTKAPPIRDLSAIDVAILFIHPNMDFEQVDRGFTKSPDGLILLSYGPGNVPDDEVFIGMLRRLLDDHTIIANITQCPYGRVELKLFETSATLFDLGVIDGYDMTLEAAYSKLLWALAAHPDKASRAQEANKESIKAAFQEDVAGEMSASIFTVHWPSEKFTMRTDSPFRVSDSGSFQNKFSRLDIAEAFIRIEGLRFPKGTDRAKVRVYYGHPQPGEALDVEPDNQLAEFTKAIGDDERGTGIDKNLEVTHTFRKAFTNTDFVLSIGLEGVPGITFKSVRLVVYTKGMRRRER
jgi:L-asparaginase type I